jgi:hypothetical protein
LPAIAERYFMTEAAATQKILVVFVYHAIMLPQTTPGSNRQLHKELPKDTKDGGSCEIPCSLASLSVFVRACPCPSIPHQAFARRRSSFMPCFSKVRFDCQKPAGRDTMSARRKKPIVRRRMRC